MLLGTAPIFKIKLLLADMPFGIAASSFHILKVWARSLLSSRHHVMMSCSKISSDAHGSDLSDRPLSQSFRSFNYTRHIFRLILQDVSDPVQQFRRNLDDRLGFTHPFAILLESLHHYWVLSYGHPGGFNQQPP